MDFFPLQGTGRISCCELLSAMSFQNGSQLRSARQQQGLSLEEAATATHIPAERLEWLEEDDLAAFGSLTYALTEARLYCFYLGLEHPAEPTARPSAARHRPLLPPLAFGTVLVLVCWLTLA